MHSRCNYSKSKHEISWFSCETYASICFVSTCDVGLNFWSLSSIFIKMVSQYWLKAICLWSIIKLICLHEYTVWHYLGTAREFSTALLVFIYWARFFTDLCLDFDVSPVIVLEPYVKTCFVLYIAHSQYYKSCSSDTFCIFVAVCNFSGLLTLEINNF